MKTKILKVVGLLALVVLLGTLGGVSSVSAAGPVCIAGGGCYATIQAAVDAAANGDTINIAAGMYNGTVNIEGKANLRLQGAGVGVTVLLPNATLPWNVESYGTGRQAAIRVVSSTNIVIDGITLDLNTVKANFVSGLLVWNSTGTLSHSLVKNNQVSDAAGGYYELGMAVKAVAPYTNTSRVAFTITDNTFQDVGRVAINMHGWINMTIARNTFMKSPGAADFGYGVELGSVSIGSITNNVFHGFNTAALSDNSDSAGIYIESAFTDAGDSFPVVSPDVVAKNVIVTNNEMYDNQYGAWLGNDYEGLVGNVHTTVTFNNNKVHNNTGAGIHISDVNKSSGASFTVTGSGNQITNNTGPGYQISTLGNGEVHVSLTKEDITGNTGDGVKVMYDSSIGTSLYDVSVTGSNIVGNLPHGVEAMAGITVVATGNWWGSSAGPVAPNNDTIGTVTTTGPATAHIAAVVEIGDTRMLNTNIEWPLWRATGRQSQQQYPELCFRRY